LISMALAKSRWRGRSQTTYCLSAASCAALAGWVHTDRGAVLVFQIFATRCERREDALHCSTRTVTT
jgi:hypothetical protein